MKFDISNIFFPAFVRFPSVRPTAAFVALATTSLIFGAAPCAHAGHWVVTLNGSTSGYDDNFTFTNNVPSSPDYGTGAPAVDFSTVGVTPNVFGEEVANTGGLSVGEGLYQMTVQATFTWTPDNAQDTSSPSYPVTVLENGYADMGILDSGTTASELMQASDGLTSSSLLDPAVFHLYATGSTYRYTGIQVGGSYVETLSFRFGTKVFSLPQRVLLDADNGASGPAGYSSPVGAMHYAASVDTTPDITINTTALRNAPTPVSAALGGTVTTTMKVTSINGFAGTVNLNLVGQMPTGSLPPLPSGQIVAGGYTTVGVPSGAGPVTPGNGPSATSASSLTGPTQAQLAARVQGTFSPASVTLTSGGSATVTLTLTSSSAGAAGTYPIEVEGDAYPTGSSTALVRDYLTSLTLQ